MDNPSVSNAIAILEFSRRVTLALLEDVPEDKWCYQPIPEANHATWIVGHIAVTDDSALAALSGQSSLAESWKGLFMGSKPNPDLAAYPSPAEMLRELGRIREGVVGWYKSASEDMLLAPIPGRLASLAPNRVALAASIAWHEGLHTGQLSLVRKSLGFAPKFG